MNMPSSSISASLDSWSASSFNSRRMCLHENHSNMSMKEWTCIIKGHRRPNWKAEDSFIQSTTSCKSPNTCSFLNFSISTWNSKAQRAESSALFFVPPPGTYLIVKKCDVEIYKIAPAPQWGQWGGCPWLAPSKKPQGTLSFSWGIDGALIFFCFIPPWIPLLAYISDLPIPHTE